jgi:hypothetical protein
MEDKTHKQHILAAPINTPTAIYNGHSPEKVQGIYKATDIGIDFNECVWLYGIATGNPYSFLYINAKNKEFRKNFKDQTEGLPMGRYLSAGLVIIFSM